MRAAENLFRALTAVCFVICVVLWAAIAFFDARLSGRYFSHGDGFSLSGCVEAKIRNSSAASACAGDDEMKTDAVLSLFGVFPIKTVEVTRVEQKKVVPGGIPFGIRIISDGVMVTAVSGINCGGNVKSPARDAGLKVSDVILSINGVKMESNDDVIGCVRKSDGKSLAVSVRDQSGNIRTADIVPVDDGEGYKIGVWVRDSSAGIGTVSFFDPETGIFGGLGHAVCDCDTGAVLSLSQGEVVCAGIEGVAKGRRGSPGQLNGFFMPSAPSGRILRNDDTGVYGTLSSVKVLKEAVPVALRQQVKTGRATMLTTVSGDSPEEYEIEIERICYNDDRAVKNMIVRVTDERLLSLSGGIVQGMSGSPIMQDGRLVGAVTHVFVGDPERGYAIFAENMIETSQQLMQEYSIKNAS